MAKRVPNRSGEAQAALARRAPTMAHRNEPKGGATNESRDLLEESDDRTIEDLIAECEPYTREQLDKDLAKVIARLCEKHGVTTREEVHAIVVAHAYEHSGEDPEQDYIELLAFERVMVPR